MKSFIKQIFSLEEVEPTTVSSHQIQLATATLLIEVSKADFSQDEDELKRIRTLLKQHFSLSSAEVESLMSLAQDHSDQSVSLQHITKDLLDLLDAEARIQVIQMMWHVVFADGEKDRYEEHIIRRTADLLYVSHSDFIKARHQAEAS